MTRNFIFQITYQPQDAIFCLTGCLFLLVPVGDGAAQINSLHLLDEGADHVIITVADWSHPDEVEQNYANNIFARNSSMLPGEFLVAAARHDELILAGLAPIDMVVSIEEGSVADHEWHFVALVDYLEVTVPINRCDAHLLVVFGENLRRVFEVFDELLRL